jgi:hypothetical protein
LARISHFSCSLFLDSTLNQCQMEIILWKLKLDHIFSNFEMNYEIGKRTSTFLTRI